MEIISIVIGFFIGIVLFYLLNKWFEIWYFGFKAISGTFMGCWIAGFLVVFLFFYYLRYIIIGLIILAILARVFRKNKSQGKSREQ